MAATQDHDEIRRARQFKDSLQAWSQSDRGKDPLPADLYTGSVDEHLQCEEPPKLWDVALRAMLVIEASRRLAELEAGLSACESPIEEMMLCALLIVGRELGAPVSLRASRAWYGDYPAGSHGPGRLTIEQQAQLGEYRVDFLLTSEEMFPDFDNCVQGPNGQTISGTKTVAKKMVLECDGHDYHDRTKKQASRDRERDRVLQQIGFLVFRYTGQDIWRDVFQCAHEAITALAKASEAEGWGRPVDDP